MYKTNHEEFVIFILLEPPCSFSLLLQSCLLKVTTISLTKILFLLMVPGGFTLAVTQVVNVGASREEARHQKV